MDRPVKKTKVPYLSPSGYKTYCKDREDYYLRYLAPVRAPRFPQTKPMSIGSAFDAYVKSKLYADLVGDPTGTEYDLDKLIESQCEKQNRDWARMEGEHLMSEYVKCGAYADLLQEFNGHLGPVQFEFTMKAPVKHDFKEVILMGKPDLHFVNHMNWPVILDFKVNGYCGRHNTSPKKGYLKARNPKKVFPPHKQCFPAKYQGTLINRDMRLEEVDADWAAQCAIYGWLSGEPVGKEIVVGIEQLACDGSKRDFADRPMVRFCSHRTVASRAFQIDLYNALCKAWEVINSDHFFRDMSLEESQRRCEVLDQRAQLLHSDDPKERFFAHSTR